MVAVAGWLFGAEAIEPIQRQAILAALVVFFAANLCVLLPATRLAAGFREELRLGAAEAGLRSEALARALGSNRHELRVPLTAGLHLSVDAAVIGVVLLEASTP